MDWETILASISFVVFAIVLFWLEYDVRKTRKSIENLKFEYQIIIFKIDEQGYYCANGRCIICNYSAVSVGPLSVKDMPLQCANCGRRTFYLDDVILPEGEENDKHSE